MVSRIEAFYIMSAAAADLKVYANYLRFFLTLQHILFTVLLLFSYVSHMWNSPKRFNSGEESLRANGTALLNHVNFESRDSLDFQWGSPD